LSLAYSASLLKGNNIKPLLIDAHALNLCVDKIIEKVKDYDKIFITTSPYDRWQCPDINIEPALKLFKALINKECYVIGTHVTFNPEKILKLTKAKAGIIGSPEFSILGICKNKELSKINNVVFLKGSKLIKTKKKPVNVNKLLLPAYDLFNPYKYEYEIFGKMFALIETTRGCIYNCNFCYHKDMFGEYSEINIKKVIKFLKKLIKSGFRTAYFIDLNFLTNKNRVKKLCKEIIRNKIRIKWCCQSRIDNLDGETANLMKKAGCELIHIGIENSSANIQKKIKKNININKTKENIKLLKKNNIKFAYFILLGLGEKEEDIKKTKRFIKETKPDYISVHHFQNFRLFKKRQVSLKEKLCKINLLMMNIYMIKLKDMIQNPFKKIKIFINSLR
jgi:radical SAM superfamily enzyme YgiQ (UPF0313 family)